MPYPDDYRAAGAPDGWISRVQQMREEAQGIADDFCEKASAIQQETWELYSAACGSWQPPAQWTARETAELMRRMDDIASVLRDLREGRMPGEKREKANDR